MATVTINNLTKSYGDHTVLDDLSLEIKDGEFISLLGPSGCGKTTLLRAIAGLGDFQKGSIVLGGKDVSNVPPQKRNIGMVFQQYSLFPNMSVRKNIAFPLDNAGMPRAEQEKRVDEMIELIGLEKHQNKRPKELSGGQQQRVALARALAPKPRILLLDEPLSALDAKVRGRLRDQIREIQSQIGITTIFVTHDQTEAFAMSDRIVLMGNGRILQVDEPSAIYSRPMDLEAADFIGSRNTVKVEANGGRLDAHGLFNLNSPVCDGEKVTCSFRSESVNVVAEGAAGQDPAQNIRGAAAVIEARTYLGATSTLKLRIDGVKKLVKASVTGSLAVKLQDGDRVRAWVDADDVNVYSGETLLSIGEA